MANQKAQGLAQFLNVSPKQIKGFLRSQQNQFNPMIKRLQGQIGRLNPEDDYSVRAFDALRSGLKSPEAIRAAYAEGLGSFNKSLGEMDFTRGAKGAASIVSSIAGGIGADAGAAQDVASTVGTVSGVGADGNDVYSKALMGGAAAKFAQLEAQRNSEVEGQRQQFTLGAAEARGNARDKQMELGRMLAQTKGQKMGAKTDPLALANNVMGLGMSKIQLLQALKDLKRSGGGGRGGAGGTGDIDLDQFADELGNGNGLYMGRNNFNRRRQTGFQ
jgi:hypothetical protein